MAVPSNKWKMQELVNQVQALEDKMNELVDSFNDHTHAFDSGLVGENFTSQPRQDNSDVVTGTAYILIKIDLSKI
jgi:hypothetical protein